MVDNTAQMKVDKVLWAATSSPREHPGMGFDGSDSNLRPDEEDDRKMGEFWTS